MPEDVRDFVARRDLCEHFLGEEPYDAARKRFLEDAIEESCSNTAKRYEALLRKHGKNPVTAAWLVRYISEFGEPIDP